MVCWTTMCVSSMCRLTVLGKLFTPSCVCSPISEIGSSPLKGCRVIADLAESNGSLSPGLWLTSPAGWLQRTGLRNPMLGNPVWATFFHLYGQSDLLVQCGFDTVVNTQTYPREDNTRLVTECDMYNCLVIICFWWICLFVQLKQIIVIWSDGKVSSRFVLYIAYLA